MNFIKMTDTLFLSILKFQNLSLSCDELIFKIIDYLRKNNVIILDIRSLGSISEGNHITSITVGILSIQKIIFNSEDFKEIHMKIKFFEYSAKDVTIELTMDCVCHSRTKYPFVGLYKGEYFDIQKVMKHNLEERDKYSDIAYTAAWLFKSDNAIQSVIALTPGKIKNACLFDQYNTFIWAFGSGFI
jgi:hypothetical protein